MGAILGGSSTAGIFTNPPVLKRLPSFDEIAGTAGMQPP